MSFVRIRSRWAAVLVAVGTGILAVMLLVPQSANAAKSTGTSDSSGLSLQNDFVRVVKAMRPSVVEISTQSGLGSGVVYDTKGDIVTNAHVVGDARTFTVTLSNGRRLAARLIGTYVPGDLAVVRVSSPKGLRPATFATPESITVGDIVLAIGSPLGLSSSVTEGIVSANGRDVPEAEGIVLPDLIQTSAAINPGNSGGALVDLSSHVIGIPTLAAINGESGSAAVGIGFAIPSSAVKRLVPQLIKSGRVTNAGRAALGISGATATDFEGHPVGVAVTAVQVGGPAAKAGIVVGELITGLNGHAVAQLNDLESLLAQLKPKSKATVAVTTQARVQRTIIVLLGDLGGA